MTRNLLCFVRATAGGLAWCLLLAGFTLAAGSDQNVPYGPMREPTWKILQEAVVAATDGRLRVQQFNLALLKRLAGTSWPQVAVFAERRKVGRPNRSAVVSVSLAQARSL